MTKKQAWKLFEESYWHLLPKNDYPMKRESWNNFTDSLCKNGDITEGQYNTWTFPFKSEA